MHSESVQVQVLENTERINSLPMTLGTGPKGHIETGAKSIIESLRSSARNCSAVAWLSAAARTIGDLAGSEIVEAKHVAEAVQYRGLERNTRPDLEAIPKRASPGVYSSLSEVHSRD